MNQFSKFYHNTMNATQGFPSICEPNLRLSIANYTLCQHKKESFISQVCDSVIVSNVINRMHTIFILHKIQKRMHAIVSTVEM